MKTASILFALTLTTLAAHADNAAVLAIFDKQCASCHDEEKPTLTGSINLTSLLGSADDVKGILDRVGRADDAKGRMPKSKGKPGEPGYLPPLSAEQVATLQTWARGEAPATPAEAARAFIPMRDEVKAVAADVLALDRAVQPTTRYITLTNLHNLRDAAGKTAESDEQLDIYRAGLSKLLNSISRAGRIAVPTAVDAAKTIYRVDLRDYGLTARDWEEHVAAGYPYALRGIDGRAEDDIAKTTGSAVAVVRADWFVFAASQPPLYHELLHLPATEQELERQQGVDTRANLRAGRALRAGFRVSGVSQGNRLIERHESASGVFWKSYDFTPLVRTGGHDLFRSPLGPVGAGLTRNKDREFVHDGGEFIFTLPNGLHAYLLTTAAGKRIDRGPTEIVQDRKRRDSAIINGISCMACHESGIKYARDEALEKFVDEVGPVALKAGLDREEMRTIQDLHGSPEKLRAAVLSDEAKYKAALELAIPGYKQAFDPVNKLTLRFKEDIRVETMAAEFGEQDATFLQRLKESRNADLESIAAQFESGLGFPRASWLEQFQLIAKALGTTVLPAKRVAYAEFTSGEPKAGGHEGRTALSEGGKLTISTDKPRYVKGELLSVKLKSTEGVFVRLYHLSAERKLTQIFPNSARTDNFLRGGETVTLGSQKEGALGAGEFRFRMKEPFGTEIILAVASPVQFTDAENLRFADGEAFKSFTETDLRKSLARGTKGLEVETTDATGKVTGSRSAPTFTARAVFSVGEK